MATHGSLFPFDISKDDWTSYVMRLKYYFEANNVTEAGKKKSMLLAVCGPATFRRISSLLTHTRLESINFHDLVGEVKEFHDPKPSTTVQRFQFNTRERAQGESIAVYVAALRKLGEHCIYGDSLNEIISDCLVCGANHDTIQPRLLAEKELTLERAFEVAQIVEAAEKNSKIIKNRSNGKQETLHYSETGFTHKDRKSDKEFKKNPTCYWCGGPHLAPSCWFKDTICRFCKKKGHVEKVCRSKTNPKQSLSAPERNFYVQEEQTLQLEDAEAYGMYTVNSSTRKPIILDVYLNEIPIKMELDTGASPSIISSTTYMAITQQSKSSSLEKSAILLKTYTGESIKVLGTTSVNARYGNQKELLTIHVVDGNGPDLMGRDWLSHFNIISWCEVNHVTKPLQGMLDKHSDVFDKDLGCMKGVEEPWRLNQRSSQFFLNLVLYLTY